MLTRFLLASIGYSQNYNAGISNTTGNESRFAGSYIGNNNTTGWGNGFMGIYAGGVNTTGSNLTMIGW